MSSHRNNSFDNQFNGNINPFIGNGLNTWNNTDNTKVGKNKRQGKDLKRGKNVHNDNFWPNNFGCCQPCQPCCPPCPPCCPCPTFDICVKPCRVNVRPCEIICNPCQIDFEPCQISCIPRICEPEHRVEKDPCDIKPKRKPCKKSKKQCDKYQN